MLKIYTGDLWRNRNKSQKSQEWKQRDWAVGFHSCLGAITVMEIMTVMEMDQPSTLKLETTALADALDSWREESKSQWCLQEEGGHLENMAPHFQRPLGLALIKRRIWLIYPMLQRSKLRPQRGKGFSLRSPRQCLWPCCPPCSVIPGSTACKWTKSEPFNSIPTALPIGFQFSGIRWP